MRKKNQQAARARTARKARERLVLTNIGRLLRLGTNEWGKALVKCPQCGAPAVVDSTQSVWCRTCGYASAGLAGCT